MHEKHVPFCSHLQRHESVSVASLSPWKPNTCDKKSIPLSLALSVLSLTYLSITLFIHENLIMFDRWSNSRAEHKFISPNVNMMLHFGPQYTRRRRPWRCGFVSFHLNCFSSKCMNCDGVTALLFSILFIQGVSITASSQAIHWWCLLHTNNAVITQNTK